LSIGPAATPAQGAPNLSMSSSITYHPVNGTNNGGSYDVYVIDIHGVITMQQ
jgi:hypothetical protein